MVEKKKKLVIKKKKKVVEKKVEPLKEDKEAEEAVEKTEPINTEEKPDSSFETDVANFLKIKADMKKLSSMESKLKENIKKYVGEVGETDSKGHKFLAVIVEGKKMDVVLERRASVSINESKAVQLCKDKSLNQCIDVIETINEDALQDAYKTGDVKDEEMQSLVITRESFALKVQEAKKDE